ncbi:Methyltransferase domain-containing protein [Rhodoblastus acidophilus]|uniref:Methyltransferase domain-containing protein n=1 Tax=Rhodoblastus acidophilus TaxID=1074 RepID=A0A212RTL9_RHOAC|nr:class I SAM-dependent methyltransferase [Rhodoblastus acidophilus]PPQ37371.1 class I SAM-dependent methyltransferase [Rhodoblastus acidophilus]RAI23157.1 class I SAM-dependent methyltransferase [Rhodoblastus acidophilus]SNB76085.1 Methyltransferase domain-containing protein [Rhodoblastus acidophilus]
MKVGSLPCLGPIANWLELDFLPQLGVAIGGRDVLALGFSPEQIAAALEPHSPKSITVLAGAGEAFGSHAHVVGDICDPALFAPESFDVVASFAVLEHIDVAAGFANINRILRPGGLFASLFGPVWSSPYGHHLFVDPNDPLLNFALWKLPGWMHLLSSPNEIQDFYRQNCYSEEVIRAILDQIYETPNINRLMYEDYLTHMNQYFAVTRMHLLYNDVPPDIYRALRHKFPHYTDFSTYGGGWAGVRQERTPS